jgi:hypothetical protein
MTCLCSFHRRKSCLPPSPLAAIGKGADKGLSSSLWLLYGADPGEYNISRLFCIKTHEWINKTLCIKLFWQNPSDAFRTVQTFSLKTLFIKCCATYFANSFFFSKNKYPAIRRNVYFNGCLFRDH